MKKLLAVMLLLTTVSPYALAASDDECSIWLCLPGGFPDGCSNAAKAMRNRIKHLKPPLPDFASCVVNDGAGGNMSSNYGVAAYIPPQSKCVKWEYTHGSHGDVVSKCVLTQNTAAQYIKGRPCIRNRETSSPDGCTTTYHYTEVLQDGAVMGETYYFQ